MSLPDVHRVEEKHDAIYSAGALTETTSAPNTEYLWYWEQAVTQVATPSSPPLPVYCLFLAAYPDNPTPAKNATLIAIPTYTNATFPQSIEFHPHTP